MNTSAEAFQQCYNAQVTANASDQGQAIAQLGAVKATYEQQPDRPPATAPPSPAQRA